MFRGLVATMHHIIHSLFFPMKQYPKGLDMHLNSQRINFLVTFLLINYSSLEILTPLFLEILRISKKKEGEV